MNIKHLSFINYFQ